MITTELNLFTCSSQFCLCRFNKYVSRVYSVLGIEQYSIFGYHLIIDSLDFIPKKYNKSFFHHAPHILSPLPLENLDYLWFLFHGQFRVMFPRVQLSLLFSSRGPYNLIQDLRSMLYFTKSCECAFLRSFCSLPSNAWTASSASLSWAPIAWALNSLPQEAVSTLRAGPVSYSFLKGWQHSQNLTSICRKKWMLPRAPLFLYSDLLAFLWDWILRVSLFVEVYIYF